MVVVDIEAVIEMERKLHEINTTPFKDLLFVSKGERKIGCVVTKLDIFKVATFTKDHPLTSLFTSGLWKECVIE